MVLDPVERRRDLTDVGGDLRRHRVVVALEVLDELLDALAEAARIVERFGRGAADRRRTPTIAASTPASNKAYQQTTPSAMYGTSERISSRRAISTPTDRQQRDAQPDETHPVGVEDRDHDDATDVVDDGEREDEDAHAERDRGCPTRVTTPTAKAMSVATGTPKPSTAPPRLISEVDQRRDEHAAECRERRQRRRPSVAELTVDELAFDLQADDEEEQRHQPAVDPLVQREVERRRSPRRGTGSPSRTAPGTTPTTASWPTPARSPPPRA